MVQRQPAEYALAFGTERQKHFPPIFAGPYAPDKPGSRQTVHQFDRAVVLNLQPFGKLADRRPHITRQAFQSQHELMLPWFQARGACGVLAERQKAAYLITQLRQ